MLRILITFLVIILLIDVIIILGAITIMAIRRIIMKNKPKNLLYKLEYGSYSEIYVDEESGVMYLFLKDGNAGGLTAMLNVKGTSKLNLGTRYYTVNLSKLKKQGLDSEIYVDEETDVMYLFVNDEDAGDLSIMLNADGTPKLSDGTEYYMSLSYLERKGISKICVDEETNVMYLFTDSVNGSGLTIMLNEDGIPRQSDETSYDTIKISKLGRYGLDSEIYVDDETDVMYLFVKRGNSGGFTMMLDADGTPKLSAGTKYDTTELSKIKRFDSKCKDKSGPYKEIYVDGENNVLYLFLKDGCAGGLTTMFNAKYPKTW